MDHLLPAELVEKYPMIDRESILDAVELATIKVMEQIHRMPAGAVVDEEAGTIWVTLYGDSNFTQVDLSTLKRKSMRRLLDQIELELMKRQTVAEAHYYHTLTRTAISGQVIGKHKNNLLVELEVIDGLKHLSINAVCPPSHQTTRDYFRGLYKVGKIMTFYALSARPVENGRRSWVNVTVSRKARELPSRMLASLTGLPGIRCLERVPGHTSRIITRHPVPKSAINTVGKELIETLLVTCPGYEKPFFRSAA